MSIMVFDLLDPRIKSVLSSRGIKQPTEPQKRAIAPIMSGKNVLLIAPTGLGKTEAALLPIFHSFIKMRESNVYQREDKGLYILYITPLRALNRDMLRRTFEMGRELDISIAVRHGDTPNSERMNQTRHPPDMLITTPETLQILFIGKRLRKHLGSVRWVVVDEVHELAYDERGAQLAVALERLYELTKERGHGFQRIGLSATVGVPEEVARFLGGLEDNGVFRDVKILEVDVTKHIDIQVELPRVEDNDYSLAERFSMEPASFASLRRCKELAGTHVSTLIFINTRDGAEILASRFHQWSNDISIGVHHGSLSKIARVEAENDFKNGRIHSLICTSSLELGIDVGNTDFVIQYNSPRQVTRLVQRVGRSGHRVGKISRGVVITTNPEDLAESMVIARRAMAGELEFFSVRQNPLSVLTNQIISIVLQYGHIDGEKVYSIVRRAYPFHSLTWRVFQNILQELKSHHTIWVDEKNGSGIVLAKRMSSRKYFLDNISMIPDEKTYHVVDIGSRRKIGTLDESFVLNYGYEGADFILRGKTWTIIKREDDEILVAPAEEIGTVPSWIGEDIPVPFEIAQEVGRLRRIVSENKNINGYPCDKHSLERFLRQIEEQKKHGFIVPTDRMITIDVEDKNVVINACFGTKVNETLGRLISALLAQSLGESIGINSDAYRINLELPTRISTEKIRDILLKTKPEALEYLIRRILQNSTFIRWQLIHVARKFGATKKDFDYKKIGTKKFFTLFEKTSILDEAINKLVWDRMDIQNTKKVLHRIQNNEIKIHIQRGISPISLAGSETIRGLMTPQRADRTILMALKKRLENTNITLACTNCYHTWNTTPKRAAPQPRCSRCGAIRIAVLTRYDMEKAKLLSKKHKTKQEVKEIRRLHKNANLILSYGKHALLTLVGRGIGPDTAARILRKYNRLDLDRSEEVQINLLRDILKAELNYARTRGFWDN